MFDGTDNESKLDINKMLNTGRIQLSEDIEDISDDDLQAIVIAIKQVQEESRKNQQESYKEEKERDISAPIDKWKILSLNANSETGSEQKHKIKEESLAEIENDQYDAWHLSLNLQGKGIALLRNLAPDCIRELSLCVNPSATDAHQVWDDIFQQLQQQTCLRTLVLECPHFTNDQFIIEWLSNNRHLKKLAITSSRDDITQYAKVMMGLPRTLQSVTLHISESNIDLLNSVFSFLTNNTTLLRFSLSCPLMLKQELFIRLCNELMTCQNLNRLQLQIPTSGGLRVNSIESLTKTLQSLNHLQKFNMVIGLHFDFYNQTQLYTPFFTALFNKQTLDSLYLSDLSINGMIITSLCKNLVNSKIEKLHIKSTVFQNEQAGMQFIQGLSVMPCLRHLTLVASEDTFLDIYTSFPDYVRRCKLNSLSTNLLNIIRDQDTLKVSRALISNRSLRNVELKPRDSQEKINYPTLVALLSGFILNTTIINIHINNNLIRRFDHNQKNVINRTISDIQKRNQGIAKMDNLKFKFAFSSFFNQLGRDSIPEIVANYISEDKIENSKFVNNLSTYFNTQGSHFHQMGRDNIPKIISDYVGEDIIISRNTMQHMLYLQLTDPVTAAVSCELSFENNHLAYQASVKFLSEISRQISQDDNLTLEKIVQLITNTADELKNIKTPDGRYDDHLKNALIDFRDSLKNFKQLYTPTLKHDRKCLVM